MSAMTMKKATSMNRLLPLVMTAAALLLTAAAQAAAPGITGPVFNLTAQPASISQPDGQAVYSWGYGCSATLPPSGYAPATITNATCPTMQVPGPTLIVTEGQTVTVTLTNGLPAAAGNTSILFPGFQVTTTVTNPGVQGLLTKEAAPGGTVTYTFTAGSPGTRAYYSGTQGDLQVEMGLYGAIIVLPSSIPAACTSGLASANRHAAANWNEKDFRLAAAAYDHAKTCYDREYLFQFSEMDPNIHTQALAQVTAAGACTAGAPGCSLNVPTEPYHPAYFMINGRSMPDDMDPNYAAPVSAPALQRQSAHASGRAGAAADHRPGPLAASVPRARQSRAHPGARRQFDCQPALIRPPHRRSRAPCCSPPPRRRAWRWMGFSTGPAGA